MNIYIMGLLPKRMKRNKFKTILAEALIVLSGTILLYLIYIMFAVFLKIV